MELERGTLAKIDRKILSGLDHDQRYQIVRVPVSEAAWSTWKRYCGVLGISMGRAIAVLVEHELHGVVDVAGQEPVFLAELEKRFGDRKVALDAREASLEVREQWLRESERRMRVNPTRPPASSVVAKVSRNERCPCGSGLKYKRCHGP